MAPPGSPVPLGPVPLPVPVPVPVPLPVPPPVEAAPREDLCFLEHPANTSVNDKTTITISSL
ncbi:MAG: hypothetical protein E3J72_17795 [Planctomycetota bacterium]|nr:MAG: hypothetical protein E3J72_17795 [Planctomycetota bacterium]